MRSDPNGILQKALRTFLRHGSTGLSGRGFKRYACFLGPKGERDIRASMPATLRNMVVVLGVPVTELF
eukprot:755706-Pyramimonas_sp.AAC.1